jgi:hypothetical protein
MTKALAVAAMGRAFSHGTKDHQDAINIAGTRTAFIEALLKNPLYRGNSSEIARIMAEYDK